MLGTLHAAVTGDALAESTAAYVAVVAVVLHTDVTGETDAL